MPAPWSTIDDQAATTLADSPRPTGCMLRHAGAVLLGAQDVDFRREHLLLPAQHHPARPSSLLLCRCVVRDSLCAVLPEQCGGVRSDDHCKCRAERDGWLLADPDIPG